MDLSKASYMHLEPGDLCSSVCPKTDGIFCAIVDATLSVLDAVVLPNCCQACSLGLDGLISHGKFLLLQG